MSKREEETEKTEKTDKIQEIENEILDRIGELGRRSCQEILTYYEGADETEEEVRAAMHRLVTSDRLILDRKWMLSLPGSEDFF